MASARQGTSTAQPRMPVIRDAEGNLYGTTCHGGSGGSGIVYNLDPSGHGTVLYNFNVTSSGGAVGCPSGLIRDESGNLYGTYEIGGTVGEGALFEVKGVRAY